MHKSLILSDGVTDPDLQSIHDFIHEWESDSPVIHVKTSGSTGVPKEMMLDKKRVRASAHATARFFEFSEGEHLLLNLSPAYIAGKLMIVRALEMKMKIVVAPVQNNPLLLDLPVDIAFGAFVPYQVQEILTDARSKSRYEQIPNVIIGGAPMSTVLEQELQKCRNTSWATFGMTETITHFALRNISEGAEFYTCLPGVTLGTDERGCLVIYKNDIFPEMVTNDLVDLVSPMAFRWKGRLDHVVNSGGVKLSPELLEKKVGTDVFPQRFYFTSREHDQLGQELILIMEGNPSSKEGVLEKVKEFLSGYEVPKDVIFTEKLEETASGKIKRRRY